MQVPNVDNVIRGFGAVVAVFTLAYASASTMFACGPKTDSKLPGYCYDESQLKARYASCVAGAETRAESDLCANQVNATCGFKEIKR